MQHGTTFSSTISTLIGGVVPSTSASPTGPDHDEVQDVYAVALVQLRQKVPTTVTQVEFDAFIAVGGSPTCTTDTQARDLLESFQADATYHTNFHKFFKAIHALFEPLKLFKDALDSMCQISPAFCLVWGSVKVLIEIAKEVAHVPAVINNGIEHLIGYFPAYQQYHKCLLIPTGEGLPLRQPLVNIYVEYLTFCILAQRLAKSTITTTVKAIAVEQSPFHRCLSAIKAEADRVRDIASALTLKGVFGVDEKLDIIIHRLAASSTMSSATSSSSTLTTSCHIVPGLLSEAFVGREAEIKWLRDKLKPDQKERLGARVGIHGMTGIGKTQLLLKYEAMHRKCYLTQVFLSAPSKKRLLDSVQEVLETLELPQRERPDPNTKILGLHNWLLQSHNWLLLVDNVAHESVDLIQQLIASGAPGHVILTSQARGAVERITGSPNLSLALQEPPLNEAVEIFINAAGIASDDESKRAGADVVRTLGLLPHAIEQAASYTRVNALTPGAFLERYKKTPDKFLEWDDDTGAPLSPGDDIRRHAISRHFRLIFSSLEKSHLDALTMLEFFSLLEAEAIPVYDEWHRANWRAGFAKLETEQPPKLRPANKAKKSSPGCLSVLASCFRPKSKVLLDDSDEFMNEKGSPDRHQSVLLQDIFRDQVRRERAVAKLCDLSLVRRIPGQRLLWMHDLTKKTTRTMLPHQDLKTWVSAALDVVYHMMPIEDSTVEERLWVDTCLPSAMGLVRQVETLKFQTSEYACFLALCALCNLRHDAWGLSQKQFEAARPEYEKYLGLEDRRTLTLMHQHAWSVRNDGKMSAAEALFRQAWELRSQALGPNTPETLAVLNDLASTIERAGRLKEAEGMFKTLHEGYRGSSGPQSRETLAAGHNYALCLHNQGRLREAADMYRTCLDSSTKEVALHDEGTLKTLANYAATLDHDGRNDDANAVYRRALNGYKGVLGFDHLLTLRLRVNLASLLKQQGRFDEAEIMLAVCLERAIFLWGAEGIETMAYLHDMGEVWQAKGDLRKARDAFKKLGDGLTEDLVGHPLSPRWIDSWGSAEREMGHLTLALEKSKESYESFEKLLGWYDPYTLVAANDYAEVLHATGQYSHAWDIYSRCRGSFEMLVGKDHPHYAMTLNNLGRCCWALKKLREAEGFFAEAQEALKNRVGSSHFCTLTVSLNVARAKAAMGDVQGAIALAEQIRNALEVAVGRTHPLVSAAHLVIGIVSASRGNRASLLAAVDHVRAAVETARDAGYTASANYYLSLSLLALLLRRVEGDVSAIAELLEELRSADAQSLSPFDIPGVGQVSVLQLSAFEPPESFDFKGYIPLSTGETVKLRWGRKTCWREAGKTVLDC